jgi:hypothetical protein
MTFYRDDYLVGTSQKSHAPDDDLALGSFDLGIFVSSYEERCTAVARQKSLHLQEARIVRFQDTEERFDQELRAFLGQKADHLGPDVQGMVEDLRGMGGQIHAALTDIYLAKGQPLNVFVDMTCLERYYLLFILGNCLGMGICRRIVFFYSEGRYEKTDGDYIFTQGEYEPVNVPFFEGKHNPGWRRFYLVSAGFEGGRALRFVTKQEPSRISVLMPHPGFHREYSRQTFQKNRSLLEEYRVPLQQIVRAPAGDAIAAWNALAKPCLYKDGENTSFLCFGTKPHTLGLGLRALLHPEVEVLYCRPKGYLRKSVAASDTVWTYEIKDLRLL